MPLIPTVSSPPQSACLPADTATSASAYGRSLILLASLFFMWGFITVINNTLLPHLKSYGPQNSFYLTAACELYVLFYALWGSRVAAARPSGTVKGSFR